MAAATVGVKIVTSRYRQRRKRPYRAPIHRSFFHQETPDYVSELLSEDALRESGLFNPLAVNQLVRQSSSGAQLGEVTIGYSGCCCLHSGLSTVR
jgi:asparagine synthetase B (glutamine-hydrolysing)